MKEVIAAIISGYKAESPVFVIHLNSAVHKETALQNLLGAELAILDCDSVQINSLDGVSVFIKLAGVMLS